jgi:hypothetical protein
MTQQSKLMSEELLYDSTEDERNETWRQNIIAKDTDAILECPCCLTTLCYSCQKHARYPNQYRAIFVENCIVVEDEILRYCSTSDISIEKMAMTKLTGQRSGLLDKDSYHPVRCLECNTEVGVYDNDQVVHFFNVIASPLTTS